MRQYWSDTGIEHYIKEFWETYGKIYLFISIIILFSRLSR
jgi:hypothetical protein